MYKNRPKPDINLICKITALSPVHTLFAYFVRATSQLKFQCLHLTKLCFADAGQGSVAILLSEHCGEWGPLQSVHYLSLW